MNRNLVKQILRDWRFLLIIIGIYGILFFIKEDAFWQSIIFSSQLLLKTSPLFLIIWLLMAFSNSLVGEKLIFKWLEKSKTYHWLLAIIGGILSSGPIYLWYPLLADLKKKGFNNGLIACFLYNRAIKLPLMPLLIYYFDWRYALTLTISMVIASIIQGVVINKLVKN